MITLNFKPSVFDFTIEPSGKIHSGVPRFGDGMPSEYHAPAVQCESAGI